MGGTTGVSLEQGLGLMGISRGRPGRRARDERALRRINIIYKLTRAPGFDSAVLVPLVSRSTLDRGPSAFVEISRATCVFCVELAFSDGVFMAHPWEVRPGWLCRSLSATGAR